MIFNKKVDLFMKFSKISEEQFSILTGQKLFTSSLSSEPLSNRVTAARFALFRKLDVF